MGVVFSCLQKWAGFSDGDFREDGSKFQHVGPETAHALLAGRALTLTACWFWLTWVRCVSRFHSTPFGVNSVLLSSPASQLSTAVVRNDIRPAAAAPPPPPYFRCASRRVQKQLQSRVTWKCVALLLVCLTAFLIALLSYLTGKCSQSALWRLAFLLIFTIL